jgi:hypothetical protein
MKVRKALNSNPKIAAKIEGSTGTVARIRTAKTHCQLDTLDKLAAAFDMQPWQLLVPGLDPDAYPVLRTLSAGEAEMYERLKGAILGKKGSEPDISG